MSHTHKDSHAADLLAEHRRKITPEALQRMKKPAWRQRQEAIELTERERTRRTSSPPPDDGDDSSSRKALL